MATTLTVDPLEDAMAPKPMAPIRQSPGLAMRSLKSAPTPSSRTARRQPSRLAPPWYRPLRLQLRAAVVTALAVAAISL